MIAGMHGVAVDGDQLAGGVGVEGAGAGVERLAVGAFDLEPAIAGQRQVEACCRCWSARPGCAGCGRPWS